MTESIDLDSFARRVLRATRTGKVSWSGADGDPRAFIASADVGSIRISEFEVEDGPDATLLEVLNPDGQVAASRVTDPHRPGPWLDWEETLKQLYSAASFDGSGASKVLEDLAEQWNLPGDPADEDIPF